MKKITRRAFLRTLGLGAVVAGGAVGVSSSWSSGRPVTPDDGPIQPLPHTYVMTIRGGHTHVQPADMELHDNVFVPYAHMSPEDGVGIFTHNRFFIDLVDNDYH